MGVRGRILASYDNFDIYESLYAYCRTYQLRQWLLTVGEVRLPYFNKAHEF